MSDLWNSKCYHRVGIDNILLILTHSLSLLMLVANSGGLDSGKLHLTLPFVSPSDS